jgi:hypothetical protein
VPRINEIKCVYVTEMPPAKQMEEGILYISLTYQTAIHLCACGCGMETVTPLGDQGWELVKMDDKVTLMPSIGNSQFPCRSHYCIIDNQIVWC